MDRSTRAGFALALVVMSAPAARADERTACVDAHIEGQRLRDSGKLRAARQRFVSCGAQSCPAPVRSDCADWVRETDAMMPTVVITARGPSGEETANVAVRVDDVTLLDRLNGMAVPVDPGEHTFRFTWADGHTRAQRLLVMVAEKNRRVTVDYAEAPPASASGSPAPSPTPAVVAPTSSSPDRVVRVPAASVALGAVGVVAMGSFALFGVDALTRGHHLQSTCAPACGGDDANTMRREAVIADVSLGVGLVAIGAAVWIFLAARSDSTSVSSVHVPKPRGSGAPWGVSF